MVHSLSKHVLIFDNNKELKVIIFKLEGSALISTMLHAQEKKILRNMLDRIVKRDTNKI